MTTLVQGVPGLEAHHVWGAVTLNDRTTWPRYDLDRITGLHSSPEGDDNRESAYGRAGEVIYPSLPRGKTVTYEGRVIGRTLPELRAAATALRGACRTGSQANLTIKAPLDDTTEWLANARLLSCDVDDDQSSYSQDASPSAWQRDFVLALRLHNPRLYAYLEAVTAPGEEGDVINVVNPGTADANPVFTVAGPVADDLVFERNPGGGASNRKVLFDSVGLAGGQSLSLNWDARTLTRVSDGHDFTTKLNFEESDWWDTAEEGIPPGAHNVRVAGGGDWSVTFWPASW